MKRLFKSRLVAVITLVALLAVTTNCGYILYPDRRQQNPDRQGEIDLPVLVMDGVWLFVFVVPGVVFLFIDFYYGTMFLPKEGVKAKPKSTILFRLNNPAPEDVALAVTLEDPAGVAVFATLLERDIASGEKVGELKMTIPEGLLPGDYRLAVKVNGETQAAWNLSL